MWAGGRRTRGSGAAIRRGGIQHQEPFFDYAQDKLLPVLRAEYGTD